MAAHKSLSPIFSLLLGALFLCLAWPAAHAGIVPILGLLVAALAPSIFLAGIFFVAYGLARSLTVGKVSAGLLTAVIFVVVGLNTRLPALFHDIANVRANVMEVGHRFEGAVGQPLHIAGETAELSARRFPYSHAAPACYGDGCLATKGFRTPYPHADYWREKVVDVVLASGFSKANQNETAPTLTITQKADGYFSNIDMQLTSAEGKLLARYAGKYRNGHRYETEDGVKSDSPSLVLEYLLHGNPLNDVAARLARNGEVYPIAAFLRHATNLSHPQGSQLGRVYGSPPLHSAPPSVRVELEVLDEKTYEPTWVIKGDRQSDRSEWSEISWDKVRWKRCETLLKPETKGAPLMQTWHLFVGDQTGRKKVRHTGNAICDQDAIWFIDYVIEMGRTTLTKYSTGGDLIYRVSFEKPNEPSGFLGGIIGPTFKAENGYLQFEWWNTNGSGWDHHVKRSLRVQLREPQQPLAGHSSETPVNEPSPAAIRPSTPAS